MSETTKKRVTVRRKKKVQPVKEVTPVDAPAGTARTFEKDGDPVVTIAESVASTNGYGADVITTTDEDGNDDGRVYWLRSDLAFDRTPVRRIVEEYLELDQGSLGGHTVSGPELDASQVTAYWKVAR